MAEHASAAASGHAPGRLLPGRNPGIDLLRGAAILLVVLHHLGLRMPLKASAAAAVLPVWLLQALNFNGYEAVFVFFVISGFLIAGHAIDRWGALPRIDARAFYGRRVARIVPLLLALVAVLAVFDRLGVPDYTIHRAGQSLPRAVLAALGLHLNWYEGRTGYLPGGWDVLWSLSIEELFYLGFPLACLLLRRRWLLVPPLLLLAASLPVTRAALADHEIWQEKAYLPGMAAIATGVLVALAADRWRTVPRPVARVLLGAGGTAVLAELLGGRWLWPLLHDGVMLVLTGGVALLLFAWRAHPPRLPRGGAWLCGWGRLSYEIYLTHMFVVFAVVRLWHATGGSARWSVLWYLPAVGACWLLGRAAALGFSMPCERALRRRWATPGDTRAVPEAATP